MHTQVDMRRGHRQEGWFLTTANVAHFTRLLWNFGDLEGPGDSVSRLTIIGTIGVIIAFVETFQVEITGGQTACWIVA